MLEFWLAKMSRRVHTGKNTMGRTKSDVCEFCRKLTIAAWWCSGPGQVLATHNSHNMAVVVHAISMLASIYDFVAGREVWPEAMSVLAMAGVTARIDYRQTKHAVWRSTLKDRKTYKNKKRIQGEQREVTSKEFASNFMGVVSASTVFRKFCNFFNIPFRRPQSRPLKSGIHSHWPVVLSQTVLGRVLAATHQQRLHGPEPWW